MVKRADFKAGDLAAADFLVGDASGKEIAGLFGSDVKKPVAGDLLGGWLGHHFCLGGSDYQYFEIPRGESG